MTNPVNSTVAIVAVFNLANRLMAAIFRLDNCAGVNRFAGGKNYYLEGLSQLARNINATTTNFYALFQEHAFRPSLPQSNSSICTGSAAIPVWANSNKTAELVANFAKNGTVACKEDCTASKFNDTLPSIIVITIVLALIAATLISRYCKSRREQYSQIVSPASTVGTDADNSQLNRRSPASADVDRNGPPRSERTFAFHH